MDVGVIGTGRMGTNHVRVYSGLRGVDSVYIYDSNEQQAKNISKRFDCLVSSSIDDLLSCVEAVSIATPTTTHYQIAREAIEREVCVLVEKPLCKTLDEAATLCAIARSNPHVVTGVGHIERFNPVVVALSKMVKNPRYISITRHNPDSSRITDTSVIEDLMIHDVDIITTLVDLKKDTLPAAAIGNDDTTVLIIDNGFPIVLSACRETQRKVREIYVVDNGVTYVGDLINQTLNAYYPPETYIQMIDGSVVTSGGVTTINISRVEPLNTELSLFVKCVEHDIEFPVSFESGFAAMKMVAVVESLLRGKV